MVPGWWGLKNSGKGPDSSCSFGVDHLGLLIISEILFLGAEASLENDPLLGCVRYE